MITIREYVEWKWKGKNDLSSYLQQFQKTKPTKTRAMKPNVRKRRPRPANDLSFDLLRRMMGDTGSRQFLKDKGSRRK
ncbi:hypothetical protein [Brevibacillus invocatus]|uniref:hypothetical protein n=1 Tax=Brevibacillus invocatus TaxID=173959 RepID=UPI00203FEEB5|nr:hypothetical protein [Brevibacillus invocatus]MCM3079620.1 hypothetical protein [Brevibacillus invocatus]MCM3429818.1 hypothetical protein [Brevibacillus invocatus]